LDAQDAGSAACSEIDDIAMNRSTRTRSLILTEKRHVAKKRAFDATFEIWQSPVNNGDSGSTAVTRR
jgi:hypothetical protein